MAGTPYAVCVVRGALENDSVVRTSVPSAFLNFNVAKQSLPPSLVPTRLPPKKVESFTFRGVPDDRPSPSWVFFFVAGSFAVMFVIVALLIGLRTFSRWVDHARGSDYEPLDPDLRNNGRFPSAQDALDQDMLFAQAPIRGSRHHDAAACDDV